MNVESRNILFNISKIFECYLNNDLLQKFIKNEYIIHLNSILFENEIELLLLTDEYILYDYFDNYNKIIKQLPHYKVDLTNLNLIICRYEQ
jgi:hypothetical protein